MVNDFMEIPKTESEFEKCLEEYQESEFDAETLKLPDKSDRYDYKKTANGQLMKDSLHIPEHPKVCGIYFTNRHETFAEMGAAGYLTGAALEDYKHYQLKQRRTE